MAFSTAFFEEIFAGVGDGFSGFLGGSLYVSCEDETSSPAYFPACHIFLLRLLIPLCFEMSECVG
jgi:hypothetical protein